MRGAIVVAALLAASPAFADDGLSMSGGVGGGAYVFQLKPRDPELIVPYREVGAEVRRPLAGRWQLVVQGSLREDLLPDAPEAAPVTAATISFGGLPGMGGGSGAGGGGEPGADVALHGGMRWRLAPQVAARWRHVRAKAGVVAGNYYNPTDPEAGTVWIYPVASVGAGSDEFHMEIGFLDSPALAASANGGLGVMALRLGLLIGPGHRLLFGAGAPYAGPGSPNGPIGGTDQNGYLSYAYQAELGGTFTIDLGGYTSTDTTGAFVAVGHSLR